MGNFQRLVHRPANENDIAVLQTPRHCPDQRVARLTTVQPGNADSLYGRVDPDSTRQTLKVAGKSFPLWVEQSGKLDATGVFSEMILDRTHLAVKRQRDKEISLRADHVIGSRDQVVVDIEIDEAEQHNDKRRKKACHREGPSK